MEPKGPALGEFVIWVRDKTEEPKSHMAKYQDKRQLYILTISWSKWKTVGLLGLE